MAVLMKRAMKMAITINEQRPPEAVLYSPSPWKRRNCEVENRSKDLKSFLAEVKYFIMYSLLLLVIFYGLNLQKMDYSCFISFQPQPQKSFQTSHLPNAFHSLIASQQYSLLFLLFNPLITKEGMQRQPSFPRTPNSSDKIRIKHYASKSLSKSGISTPSPVIASKANFKQPKELGIIKEKVRKRIKQEKKKKDTGKAKEQTKTKQNKESIKSKKKTNFATCLKELKPLNLEKQKVLFFESQFQKNPFFVYPNISDIMDEEYKENMKYDSPNGQYLGLALKILEKGAEINFATLVRQGEPLTLEETAKYFEQYIKRLEISEFLNFQFAENTISTTSVVHNNVEAVSTVVIGLPIRYTKNTIQGVLNHEIGTHFLRKFNDRSQKWFKQRKKYNLGQYLQTEEGLAALNQMIPFILDGTVPPLLYRAAMLYLGCYLAAQVSFCELFRLLEKHQPDPQLRWKECVRVKRGVADTAKPGGMYKDQIYFMGAINVLKNRQKINFNELHCGKINVEDCLKLSEKGQISYHDKIKLPHFMTDMKLYMRCLDHIAEVNEIK